MARHGSIVSGMLLFLIVSSFGLTAQAAGKRILFVVQLKAKTDVVAADKAVEAHLVSKGYAVTDIDQLEPAPPDASADMILISSSVSAHKLEAKYRNASIPVMTWESYILPHMGMAGMKEDTDFGTVEKNRYLWMVNAPQPLSAGLGSGMLNAYKRGAGMNWGKPGLGAIIISTIAGEPNKVTEFAYEKGATMDYENIAPAKRLFIFLDNTTFTNLNAAGLDLFDAAISWSLERSK
ncbi:MAG TPA: hypothetical protein VJ998_02400 [Pseudomonadales bacterium]|nr:hypothetical protein [Pseudomonadales bacterium]